MIMGIVKCVYFNGNVFKDKNIVIMYKIHVFDDFILYNDVIFILLYIILQSLKIYIINKRILVEVETV